MQTKRGEKNMKFADFLYALRKEKGLTQTELAEKLGVTNKAVSKWETGESFPDTAQLLPLADILGVTVDELLRGERAAGQFEGAQAAEHSVNSVHGEFEAEPERVTLVWSAGGIACIVAGVMLILLGLIPVLINEEFGTTVFFWMLALAVFLFIVAGMFYSAPCSTDPVLYRRNGVFIAVGVACILAVLPVWILAGLGIFFTEVSAGVVFFTVLALSVGLFVFAGMTMPKDKETVIREYRREHRRRDARGNEIASAISGVIMILATVVYLLLGFLRNLWHPGWLVFPIGGMICAIIRIICGIWKDKK